LNILVTGAGGFVGRHLVAILLEAGYEVVGIDSAAAACPPGADAVEGDLGDRTIRRKAIDGVIIRLPGILARPRGPSGMKSAFMSDLFHALRAGEPFVCPVSPAGTIWAQSLERAVANVVHALDLDTALLPPTRAVTLPALRVAMRDLVEEIARQCNVPAALVTYQLDAALEAAFAAQPPLATPAAERAGFSHDGDIATLVASALRTLAQGNADAIEQKVVRP